MLAARPGVTSLAALLYRDEERLLVGEGWERVYVEQVMPAKLAIDRAYVERQSLWLDLKILAATALAPLPPGMAVRPGPRDRRAGTRPAEPRCAS